MSNNQGFAELVRKAHLAGSQAAADAVVQPMVVVGGDTRYFVADGVCGFAWIKILPGNSAFANYLKKNGFARKGYGPGVDVWVSAYDQSMQRKEAYARAYAAVLQDAGIKAYSQSRMD